MLGQNQAFSIIDPYIYQDCCIRSAVMYVNTSQSQRRCVAVGALSVGVLWLALCCSSTLLLAQERSRRSQVEALAAISEETESLPLTTAQEQARQLATVLVETPGATPATGKRTPLGVVFDQPVQPGTRVIVPIFAVQGVEGRIVSGEQTFASPVEEDGATVTEDARRPLFLPASKTAIAVEILVE
jgi:hypothetical protein